MIDNCSEQHGNDSAGNFDVHRGEITSLRQWAIPKSPIHQFFGIWLFGTYLALNTCIVKMKSPSHNSLIFKHT